MPYALSNAHLRPPVIQLGHTESLSHFSIRAETISLILPEDPYTVDNPDRGNSMRSSHRPRSIDVDVLATDPFSSYSGKEAMTYGQRRAQCSADLEQRSRLMIHHLL